MSVGSIEELFIDELKDLYSAEHQITKTLPKLVKAATTPELKKAFENHLKETEGQIERLDRVFEILGKSPRGKTCAGMKGVLEEGAEMLKRRRVRSAMLPSSRLRNAWSTTRWPAMEASANTRSCLARTRLLSCLRKPSRKKRPPTPNSARLPGRLTRQRSNPRDLIYVFKLGCPRSRF